MSKCPFLSPEQALIPPQTHPWERRGWPRGAKFEVRHQPGVGEADGVWSLWGPESDSDVGPRVGQGLGFL